MGDVLIILGLVLLNGLFSMSELALVSARRMRLEKLAREGRHGATIALELAAEPSRYLSTIQSGITLISIFLGAYGEASLVGRLSPLLTGVPVIGPWSHALALALVVVAITFVSIILGELVPKRIAIEHPELMATLLAPLLRTMSLLLSPFVKALSLTTDFIIRLLGVRQSKDETPTEEEIAGMLKESTEAGIFEKTEYDIVSRALRLDDRAPQALMTPRIDLELLDLDEGVDENLKKIASTPYSRYPVYRRDRSQLLGMVHARDLFGQAIRAGSLDAIDIDSAVRPLLYVPESVSAMDLIDLLKQNRSQVALIVDEYGDIQGMVTLSDLMGALVGEVGAMNEHEEADAVQREDGSWLLDAGMPLDRFRDVMKADARFPGEEEGHYHTLAGFVLYQLGYIPKPGENFLWNGVRFEIVDMDGNRIDRLLVSRQPGASARRAL